jgi:hypothetical protein
VSKPTTLPRKCVNIFCGTQAKFFKVKALGTHGYYYRVKGRNEYKQKLLYNNLHTCGKERILFFPDADCIKVVQCRALVNMVMNIQDQQKEEFIDLLGNCNLLITLSAR